MPSNPLTQEEINEYAIGRILNPPGYTGLSPYMPQGYFLSTPSVGDGPALWRLFDASFISSGTISPDRLGSGSIGLGDLYLADDGTWKAISIPPTPTLHQVTTAGNTTTNSITVGNITASPSAANGLIRADGATTGAAFFYNSQSASGSDRATISVNAYYPGFGGWVLINNTIPSWLFQLRTSEDDFVINRAAAGTSSWSALFRIANTGNVLINTTTDAGYKLDVNGTIRTFGHASNNTTRAFTVRSSDGFDKLYLNGDGSITMNGSNRVLYSNGFSINAGGDVPLNIPDQATVILGRQSRFVTVDTGGTSYAYFNKSLLVGSNVAATSMFQVTGSITAASALARGVYFNNTLVAAANNDVLVGLDINPTFTNGAFTGVNNRALRATINNTVYAPALLINNATGQYINTLDQLAPNLTTTQSVAFTLGVSAAVNNTVGFNFYYAGSGSTSNAVTFTFWGGSPLLWLRANGNLQLGTSTDAGYKLDVNGTFRSNNSVYLATASGSVGIGTTTPNYILDVYQTNVKAQIRSTGENQNATLFLGTPFGGTSSPKVAIIARAKTSWSRADLAFCLSDNQSSNSVEATISDLRMVILSDGKVGVNVANPTYQFQVSGDIALSGSLVPTAGSQTLGTFTNRFGDVWAGGLIVGSTFYGDNHQSASGTLYFKDGGGVEKMRMTSVGNFLIGTTTDTGEKLQVNGTVRASAFAIGATAGWTGTINIPTNPPGQQNIDVQGGIITNVS